MAVGGERSLTIPAHLANFKNLVGVPPNCQLILDIELLEIMGESIREADSSGPGADFELGAEQDEPPNEAAEFKRDSHQHEGSPLPLDKKQTQTTMDEYDVGFVEAQTTASWERGFPDTQAIWGSPPSESDIAASGDEDKKLKLERSEKSPPARQSGQAEYPKIAGPTVRVESDIEHGADNGRDQGFVLRAEDMKRRKSPRGQRALLEQVAKAVQIATGRPKSLRSSTTRIAALSSNLLLQPGPNQQLEDSDMESPRSGSELGPDEIGGRVEELPKAEEELDSENAGGASTRSRGKRIEGLQSLLVFDEETQRMREYSTEAVRGAESFAWLSHDSGTPPWKSAAVEEDSPPRLKRVGHVQFDGFAGMGAHSPADANDAASGGAEEAGYPLDPSSADATKTFEAGTPSVNLAKSGNPFRNPFGETEDLAISKTEKHTCTLAGCGKTVTDLKAHMITHQEERPEKCPFTTCRFHTRGFAQSRDKDRHLVTHYEGITFCGFCSGSGSGAQRSFHRIEAFKAHLRNVHGARGFRGRKALAQKDFPNVPDATGICDICNESFTCVHDFFEHLDNCVLRIVLQESLPKSNENSKERPRRLDSVRKLYSSTSMTGTY
ncbi:hypothetical protein V8C26DRAFT_345514 [Trichoderma gracile]